MILKLKMKVADAILKFKLKIADVINLAFPDACWTELVMWAYYGSSLQDAIRHGETCKGEEGGCYCGKFCDVVIGVDEVEL